jgi:hypothetical protein
MEYELHRLGVGVDPKTVLRTAEARRITFDASTDAEWRLDAIALAELHPEQMTRPIDATPAERAAVFERLATLDRNRAAAYRAEHADAITVGVAGRERQRNAIAELRQTHESTAWYAERRLRDIATMIQTESAKVERLSSLRGVLALGTEPALDSARNRLDAFQREAKGLEDTIGKARAAITKLAEERVL